MEILTAVEAREQTDKLRKEDRDAQFIEVMVKINKAITEREYKIYIYGKKLYKEVKERLETLQYTIEEKSNGTIDTVIRWKKEEE